MIVVVIVILVVKIIWVYIVIVFGALAITIRSTCPPILLSLMPPIFNIPLDILKSPRTSITGHHIAILIFLYIVVSISKSILLWRNIIIISTLILHLRVPLWLIPLCTCLRLFQGDFQEEFLDGYLFFSIGV